MRELFDALDRIKNQIMKNTAADGSYKFNVQHMKWMLQLAEKTLQDSIESYSDAQP